MFIVDLTYKVELSIVDKFVPKHRAWLDEAYSSNKFLCSGAKNLRTGGIIIALTRDLTELKELLSTDPFYINEIADYTITEFQPSKCLQDFSRFIILNL